MVFEFCSIQVRSINCHIHSKKKLFEISVDRWLFYRLLSLRSLLLRLHLFLFFFFFNFDLEHLSRFDFLFLRLFVLRIALYCTRFFLCEHVDKFFCCSILLFLCRLEFLCKIQNVVRMHHSSSIVLNLTK